MQNENVAKTNILNELPRGSGELGDAFAKVLNDMVLQSGITNPQAEPFDIVPDSWRKLADSQEKTPEDEEKLDKQFKEAVKDLAESFLLHIARKTDNKTGKLTAEEYEKYLLEFRFGRYNVMKRPEYLKKIKAQIQVAFKKLSSHGEPEGDDLIDKNDMAAYIFALSTRSKRNEEEKFQGFIINGYIYPEDYAVNEANLFEDSDNLFSVKLRTAYKVLNDQL